MADPTGCRKCGAYIEWIITENNKSMPVDPKEVTVVTKEGGKTVKGFIPHWVTCSDPDHFRKKK